MTSIEVTPTGTLSAPSTPEFDGGLPHRTQVIQTESQVSVTWWIICPQTEGVDARGGTPVHTTLRTNREEPAVPLAEYVGERIGWVDPLKPGFMELRTLPMHGGSPAVPNGAVHKVTEAVEVAGVPVVVDSYRREEVTGKPTATTGDHIREQLRSMTGQNAANSHAVVWIQPMRTAQNAIEWLEKCKATVEGFVGPRMDVNDLQWERVSSWLAVLHTPWATFATWASDKTPTYLPILDARVRHWVVDPVILATAQQAHVQGAVCKVASLNAAEDLGGGESSVSVRDDFYAWRARNWWLHPAKAVVATKVWEGAAQANNTIGQMEALSREMADYASVEEGRHHRAVEAHNTRLASQNVRLAWGALVFALLAILAPLVFEGLGVRIPVPVAIGIGATLAIAFLAAVLRKFGPTLTKLRHRNHEQSR